MQLKQTAWMEQMEARERGLKRSQGVKKAQLKPNTESARFE